MDRRFADRRREVGESHAKSGLVRSLGLLGVLSVVAFVVWLLHSPYFSVSEVRVEGEARSAAGELARNAGAEVGRPMILVNADAVTAAILTDPWVADAVTERHWPHLILIDVTERVPAAWVLTGGFWNLVSVDGNVLKTATGPEGEERPIINGGAGLDDSVVLAAVRFADALRKDLAVGAVLAVADGQITAVVMDYQVRVGGPEDVEVKAKALAAVLDTDPEPGSVITVIAPTRPAVAPPTTQP